MLKLSGMLMIGSANRNVGKTEFACSLIKKFCSQRNIIGIKVTAIDHTNSSCPRGGEGCGACSLDDDNYVITEETDSRLDKDTCRMLAAGAKKVFWIRALKTHLNEAITELMNTIGNDAVSICESNSLRQVVEPGLFFMLKRPGQIEKASAEAAVYYADRIVVFDGSKLDIDADEIELVDDKWAAKLSATAIIMAGGESTRMGADKSMLPVEGKPIIEHIYNQLKPNFNQILISSNDVSKYDFIDAKVVPDRLPGCGSLMGIASAMKISDNDLNFVIACDIPLIDFDLVRIMLRQCRRCDAVIPKTAKSHYEPLFAVYTKSILAAIEGALASGDNKIMNALSACKVKHIDLIEAGQLQNLNTMDDYEEFVNKNNVDI